jgi:hypothetical protein
MAMKGSAEPKKCLNLILTLSSHFKGTHHFKHEQKVSSMMKNCQRREVNFKQAMAEHGGERKTTAAVRKPSLISLREHQRGKIKAGNASGKRKKLSVKDEGTSQTYILCLLKVLFCCVC